MKLKLPPLVSMLLVSMLLWVACDRPLWYVEVTKDTLHEKMSLYPNDEAVSWWYTGDDGTFRYFVMKKEGTWPDDGYKVPEETLDFIRDKEFDIEHGSGRDRWKRVSRKDFTVKGSLLQQTIAIPNKVRGRLEGLTQDGSDSSEDDSSEDDFEDDYEDDSEDDYEDDSEDDSEDDYE